MPTAVLDRATTTNVLKQLVQMTNPDNKAQQSSSILKSSKQSLAQPKHHHQQHSSDMTAQKGSQQSSQVTRKLMALYGAQAMIPTAVIAPNNL